MLVVIASDDALQLGVLSSQVHVLWSLRTGGWLGIGNDPRYSKSRCFDPFPFPETTEMIKGEIRSLAEELDQTRKLVLNEHADLTLTGIYNILEKVKRSASLTKNEEDSKMRGRVLILKDLHERIDAAVFRAYGWPADSTDDQIVERLVALNVQRTADERRGFIRWLRPDYQVDRFGRLAHRADRVQSISVSSKIRAKQEFPPKPKEQAARVLRLLRTTQVPLTPKEIALSFAGGERLVSDVEDILKSLRRLGDAETFDNGRSYFGSAA